MVTDIVSKLFGPSGILSLEDQVTFDELRDELTDTYDIPFLSAMAPYVYSREGGAYPYMDLNAKCETLTTMFYYD